MMAGLNGAEILYRVHLHCSRDQLPRQRIAHFEKAAKGLLCLVEVAHPRIILVKLKAAVEIIHQLVEVACVKGRKLERIKPGDLVIQWAGGLGGSVVRGK